MGASAKNYTFILCIKGTVAHSQEQRCLFPFSSLQKRCSLNSSGSLIAISNLPARSCSFSLVFCVIPLFSFFLLSVYIRGSGDRTYTRRTFRYGHSLSADQTASAASDMLLSLSSDRFSITDRTHDGRVFAYSAGHRSPEFPSAIYFLHVLPHKHRTLGIGHIHKHNRFY